jgi:hypothetical protein
MLGGAMLLLAGCPASKTPEPAAPPAANTDLTPPKVDLAPQAPPAPPLVTETPADKAPEKPASRSATEAAPGAKQTPRPDEAKKPDAAALLMPPLAPSQPEPPPAKPELQPAAKTTPPIAPSPSAKPAAKTTSALVAPPAASTPVVQPPLKPLVTVDRTHTPASPMPPAVAGDLIRSPQPQAEPSAVRPTPLPTSPAYTSPGGWTARPNPLRGGEAPSAAPSAASAAKPSVPQTPPVATTPKPEMPPAAVPAKPEPRVQTEAAVAAANTPSPPVAADAAPRHIEAGMGRGATKKTNFDPIKENGPIFVGWTKPRAALVITGRQDGYIEPCGCAGLDRMKGGISRRHTFFEQLRGQGWPIVCMDLGGISKGFGRQAELKFQTTVEALKRMGYHAIGLGSSDLRLPGAELLSVAKGVDNQQSPFISANVGLFTFDPPMIDPYRVVAAGGMKIGITAVLGTAEQKLVQNGDVLKEDPTKKLAEILPKLRKEADYLVLLAFASTEECTRLARRFPEFKVVVTAGGGPEPPAEPALIDGKTLLVEVGEKGMNAIVLGLYDDAQRPWRYQRVPLDSRFKNSHEMRMLMESYQDQLKSLGYAGLGLRAVPHPQKKLMGGFVGSEKCEACHTESYRIWKKSGHARAYQTLASLSPPRNVDPECIACHVIGWHPQEWFPYEGGFDTHDTTPKLINVGCESCHGPGAAHAAAELADNNEKLQGTLRKAMTVTKDEAHQRMCLTCHDGDNSPDFKFETYWPHVEHYEKK